VTWLASLIALLSAAAAIVLAAVLLRHVADEPIAIHSRRVR
jgi:hypothetical protein